MDRRVVPAGEGGDAGRIGDVARKHPHPAVEYALTPLGHSMLEPLDAVCAWAAEYWDQLLDARERDPGTSIPSGS